MSPPSSFVPVPGISYETCRFPNPDGTVAVCCLWQPVERAVELFPDAAIVGPCYSAFGVGLIVRTLLANPRIGTLIVQGPDLSGTRKLLEESLWSGTGVLSSEVARASDGLVASVGWDTRMWGDGIPGTPAVMPDGGRLYLRPHREAIVLPVEPAPVPESPTGPGWPGVRVVGESLWAVWPRVLREIVSHGAVSGTTYGSRQRELLGLTWVFGVEATLSQAIPAWLPDGVHPSREVLDDYADAHFVGAAPKPEGVAYTYADRLRSSGDDQIERVVEVLRKAPEQRRAWCSTWDVGAHEEEGETMLDPGVRARASDAVSSNAPCLVGVWFRRDRDGSLFTHATFRSHDLPKAGIQNAWGLARLAEHVAKELGWKVGKLAICSLSAHAYEQDWGWAKDLAAMRGRSTFEDDADRAILNVRKLPGGTFDSGCHEELIAVDLLAPDGRTLATITGATAEQTERRVLRAGWVATLSHAAWMGRMLSQVEVRWPVSISPTPCR